jgi:hypothetical protein
MKQCKQCKSQFEVTERDKEFYKKLDIPEPSMCPDCRMQRRFMFRNFFNLYHRKCDLTGKSILSMYDADAPFPVYEMKEWWSDKWDPLEYGFNIDFSKSVFEQIKILHETVPRMSISNINCENTEYCNFSFNSKNCYLVFGNVGNEDCCYGHIVWQSKDCFDCLYTYASEFCYQCTDCVNCNTLSFSLSCDNCSDSRFLVNCLGCRDCFGCVGLKEKQYHIFNKSHSKEEYEAKIKEFNSGDIKLIGIAQQRVKKLVGKEIVKHFHGFNCENVTGDYLYNCKNCFHSFDLKNCEDCSYCATLDRFNNSYDCNFSAPPNEWSYNALTSTGHHMMMCHSCVNTSDLYYCDNCVAGTKDCFGCVGLKNKKYCIFNKQYAKEEYEKLLPKLIEQMRKEGTWGEFFPADFSPFAYTEAMCYEYFPLIKEKIEKNGWRWKDLDKKEEFKGKKYEIPDDIKDVSDEICDRVLVCEKTGRHYKIIPKELKFYRDFNLPIPRRCPDQRHKDRMALRNPRKLIDSKCARCQTAIKTTYTPDRPETVYCEECYLKEIY